MRFHLTKTFLTDPQFHIPQNQISHVKSQEKIVHDLFIVNIKLKIIDTKFKPLRVKDFCLGVCS